MIEMNDIYNTRIYKFKDITYVQESGGKMEIGFDGGKLILTYPGDVGQDYCDLCDAISISTKE